MWRNFGPRKRLNNVKSKLANPFQKKPKRREKTNKNAITHPKFFFQPWTAVDSAKFVGRPYLEVWMVAPAYNPDCGAPVSKKTLNHELAHLDAGTFTSWSHEKNQIIIKTYTEVDGWRVITRTKWKVKTTAYFRNTFRWKIIKTLAVFFCMHQKCQLALQLCSEIGKIHTAIRRTVFELFPTNEMQPNTKAAFVRNGCCAIPANVCGGVLQKA